MSANNSIPSSLSVYDKSAFYEVVAATGGGHGDHTFAMKIAKMLKDKAVKLCILAIDDEYGIKTAEPKTYTAGLGDGEIGILLDRKLVEYASDLRYHDRANRLALLKNLPQELQNKILASRTIEELSNSSNLFFAYASTGMSLSIFIKYICEQRT